jgi:hypothetical protein
MTALTTVFSSLGGIALAIQRGLELFDPAEVGTDQDAAAEIHHIPPLDRTVSKQVIGGRGMRAVAYVGRIGGLAVALGIGTVIAGAATGQAWAAPADSSSAQSSAPAKAAKSAAGPRAHPAAAAQTRTAATPAASQRATAGLQSVPVRLSGGNPGTPRESPVTLVVAAASRRPPGQVQSGLALAAPVSAAVLVVQSAAASAKTSNPFNNQTPTMHPVQIAEDANGVVTGSLNTVDPDSSTETYTVTSNPGHGSVVVNTDGTYTYTPVEAAVHTGITDSFTVTVSDAGSGFHLHGLSGLLNLLSFGLLGNAGHTSTATVDVTVTPVPVPVPISVPIAPPPQLTFDFVYGSGSEYWTADARNALTTAANSLAFYLVLSAPVTVSYTVIGENNPSSNVLASSSVDYAGSGAGFYNTVVQTKTLTGVDLNGPAPDAEITWNFSYSWATGDSVSSSQYDLEAVALHELVHTLGFLSGAEASPDSNWTQFDRYLVTADDTPIVASNYTINPAYLPTLTGGVGGLYFGGPNAVAAYGGLLPLYTPSFFAQGSSVSHLDPSVPSSNTHVMNPFSSTGLGPRVISPVELGVLKDLGYTISNSPVYLLLFVFPVFRRRRRDDNVS